VNNNLYLDGDGGHPITIKGPVVVNGNVIISGVVKGQGAIYATGSIYVVGNLTYSKSPSGVPNSTDYAKNIQQMLTDKSDLIITVGFLLGVDTATAAKANPNQKFAIVDYTYPDCYPGAVEGKDCGSSKDLPNVRGLAFQTDQAAFLAGYLAAGMSKTGTVGTWGGIAIPTVTIFMKGFQAGVMYYNTKHSASVKVLGWDDVSQKGTFINSFTDTDAA
jgi:basic membrane protein A